MSDKVWVIRNNRFGYNDEYYCAAYSPSNIQAIYYDQKQAKSAYDKFEIAAFRSLEIELESIDVFCSGGYDELLKKLDDFVLEKTGESFIKNGRLDNCDIIYEMSDDDLLQFIKLAEINQYLLVEFDINEKLFVLWLTQLEEYYAQQNDNGEQYLAYSTNQNIESWDLDSLYDRDLSVSGTLDELSEQPDLLKKVIETSVGCDYYTDEQILSISYGQALLAINPLLKKPIFEIRQLTIEQVVEIEAQLN